MANTRPCCTFDAQTGFPDPRLTLTQVSPDVAHRDEAPDGLYDSGWETLLSHPLGAESSAPRWVFLYCSGCDRKSFAAR